MPCFVANCAVVSSPRSASSATFALKSAEYRFRLLVIQVRLSQKRTELNLLSEFRGPPHNDGSRPEAFNASEIGALAHLYRGELYRSTVWRTRLDATTNWAVVSTGLALSMTFASANASPLPLVLVGLLGAV